MFPGDMSSSTASALAVTARGVHHYGHTCPVSSRAVKGLRASAKFKPLAGLLAGSRELLVDLLAKARELLVGLLAGGRELVLNLTEALLKVCDQLLVHVWPRRRLACRT